MHLLACLTNSLGLVLTLTTLSSNILHLTTSLLDGYVSGQVLHNTTPHHITSLQVGVSLLLVLMGLLGLLVFLVLTERLARWAHLQHLAPPSLVQYLLTGGTVPTDTIQTPRQVQGVR